MGNFHLKPLISIIAIIGKNRELGKDNKLLWQIPQDLKRFKRLTMGHPVIMGRTTYESLGKPLPGRTNIVVSRQTDLKIEGCQVVHSITEAVDQAKKLDNEEIFIIGGGKIYEQAIDLANRLYLTVVDATAPADTFFPDYSKFTKIISHQKRNGKNLNYRFYVLEKLRNIKITK